MDLLKKYFAPGEDWARLSERVSGIMQYRHEREAVEDALRKKLWLPNSPTLINAGRPGGRNLAACHLLHVENSIEGIFEANKNSATIYKSGGGLGLELSALSPAGSSLKYAPQGKASGPVSFMKVFDVTAQVVMEGGLRRAAIMATLNVEHEDILRFIVCKEYDGALSNFNISVTLNDGPGEVPSKVWNAIVNHAHFNGEPGMVFLDNANGDNPTLDDFGRYIGCNACAEIFMYHAGSCILGSLVLPNVIEKLGDWSLLKQNTRLLTRFLNRVIDVNHYPLAAIAQQTRKVRRIGVGVMGWATLLKREKIPFVSADALALASEIAQNIYQSADMESWELAKVNGGYLPRRRRNATVMAIAPTGHLARLAGVSHSIYVDDYAEGLEMSVEQHLDHVAVWQRWVDNAVSYTISFPHDAPVEVVDRAFRGAHERGLKAMSVYRDGSREGQPCKAEGVCRV